MILIDGSYGEGGGQILRSSLALSVVTGEPFTIHKIRAGRDKPGLRPQHLASVRAAAEICGAELDGDRIASRQLVFRPGPLRAGEYRFDVGTAGSTNLVLQTVLPALMLADAPSRVTIVGGTHNAHAPPCDFLTRVWLPCLRRIGVDVEFELRRPGFYPAGGGEIQVTIPAVGEFRGLTLLERGAVRRQAARAVLSKLPRHIGEREVDVLVRQLGWRPECGEIEEVAGAISPGNLVFVEMEYEHVAELITGFGSRGVPAEKVARDAGRQALLYLKQDAPVGEHLADQLLLPLALAARTSGAASQFRTAPLSEHSRTNIATLREFLDVPIAVSADEDGVLVQVGDEI